VADHFRVYRPFEDALRYVRSLKLKSGQDWRCASGKPEDIPAKPDTTYRGKGWVSMGHWLGTGSIAPRLRKQILYPTFEEARTFVRSLGLKTQKEWEAFCRGKIKGLPPFPANMSKSQEAPTGKAAGKTSPTGSELISLPRIDLGAHLVMPVFLPDR
jgi:hypothetical protein